MRTKSLNAKKMHIATVVCLACMFSAAVVVSLVGCEHGSRIERSLDIAYNWGGINGSVTYSSGQVVAQAGIKVSGGDRVTYTGSDGSYTMANMAPGTYVLTAVWDGTHTENSGTVEVSVLGGSITSQDVAFGNSGLVTGIVVTGTAKTPVSGASVIVDDDQVTTGTDGTFFFLKSAGTYTLEVSKTGYTGVSQSVTVSRGSDSDLEVSLAAISSSYRISGTVTDAADNEGVEGATIEFTDLAGVNETTTAATATDGSYLVSSLAGGDYLVQAMKDDYVTSSTNVTLSADKSDLDFTLSAEGAAISGKVLSAADDSGVADVYVKAVPDPDDGTFYEGYTGSDGSYSLTVPYPADYDVTVEKSGYQSPAAGTASLSSTAQTKILNFDITPLYDVAGTVKDALTEEGIQGATLELVLVSGGGVAATTAAASDGTFSFSDVTFGTYRLEAGHADYDEASTVIDLSDDVTGQELTMEFSQVGFTLSGLVYNVLSTGQAEKDVLSFTSVTLSMDGTDMYSSMSNVNGTFTVEAVAPGQYDIKAAAPGFLNTTITKRVAADLSNVNVPMTYSLDTAKAVIAGKVLDEDDMEPTADAVVVELWGISSEVMEVRYGRFPVEAASGGGYYLLNVPTDVGELTLELGLTTGSGDSTQFITGTTREIGTLSSETTYIYDIIKP